MSIQKIMAFASFVLLGVTTYNVVTHMQMKAAEAEKKKLAAEEARASNPDKATADSSAASPTPAAPPSAQRSLLSDGLGLMTGINLQIPKAQDYALIR